MRKMLAVLMTFSMVLAGCMDLTDEDVESIVDSIVDLPGCNDETAYNYDENATNNLACLTEQVLKDSVTDFINLVDNGPAWGETMGMMMEGSETDSDGMTTSFTTTMAVSPDGMFVMTEMDMGMMVIEIGELMTENEDGTTNIQTTWMGNTFQMNTEAVFDDHWNEQSFNEDDDDHDEDHSDEMVCYDMDTHTVLAEIDNQADCENGGYMWVPADSGPGGDDSHDGDHSDDMDDMDDMDLGLPDTDVEIPDDFDPATALYTAGLSTSNGYSFTTVVEHDADYSTTMTFTLSTDLAVTSLVMVEDYDGMTSTSSITILDTEAADQLLVNDETLVEQALPFTLSPMGGDDHGDHDGHDHGDHDGHDHGDHDDEEMVCYDMSTHSVMMEYDNMYDCEGAGYMWTSADGDGDDHDGHDHDGGHDTDDGPMFTCANGDEIPLLVVNNGEGDCDGSDEPQYDSEGNETSSFTCMDGSQIMLSQVNDGNEDCLDGDDEAPSMDDGHDHDDHEEMIYDCAYIIAIDSLVNDENGQPDYTNSWDGTNLDTSLCGNVVENPEDYQTLDNGILNLPTAFYGWDFGDDAILHFSISNNELQLVSTVDSQEECYEGTYNADDGTCLQQTGVSISASDETMMIWSHSDGEELTVLYQYDSTTGSGILTALDYEDDDDDDDHDGYVFYCSNDGEAYANSMGGILCPDGAGVVPTCPDGEPCVCIDVDGSCDDGDDDWGYESHDDHGDEEMVCYDMYNHAVMLEYDNEVDCENAGYMWTSADGDDDDHDGHDHGDHDDHDDHMMAYDWMIDTADMMSDTEVIGAFADYHIVLANCVSESSDDMMGGETLSCGDDVLKVTIAEATSAGAEVMFHDADMSGTITEGDMIHINPDIDAGGEWNTVRLYSVDADKYSDENPMMTPGFGAFAGIVALLGAALLTRRD